MTKDELEKLIFTESKNYLAVAEAFAGWDEGQRRALSTHAQSLHKQIVKSKALKSSSDIVKAALGQQKGSAWEFWHHPYKYRADLCLYALAPLSAWKSRDLHFFGERLPAFETIIRDRKPNWMTDWVLWQCEPDEPQISFFTIWDWIKDGLVTEPEADDYYRLFANGMMATGFYQTGPGMPISQALKQEPRWLSYVPTLFRVESNAFNTNSWFKKSANWPDALVKLLDEGVLNREEILRLTLDGLSQDLKQNQLSGIHKLHDRLSPTIEEQTVLAPHYLDLMEHRVGHVSKFALSHIKALLKVDSLDVSDFLRRAEDCVVIAAKGNAKLIMALLKEIIKDDKADPAVTAVLLAALKSDYADIQALALDHLDGVSLSETQTKELKASRDFLAVSLHACLDALTGGSVKADLNPVDLSGLDGLSARQKAALGIEAIENNPDLLYGPVSANPRDHMVLNRLKPLTPIQSVDELIDSVAQAVERTDTPDVAYQIIDGISRLCHQRDGDFEAKTAPLVTRLEKLSSDIDVAYAHQGLVKKYGGLGRALWVLIRRWLRPHANVSLPDSEGQHYVYNAPYRALLKALTQRVSKGQARPLLSTPSHEGGWLDPHIWVQRLNFYHTNGWDLEPHDVLCSLPRLAFDFREDAFAALGNTALRDVAAFVLGASDTIDKKGDPVLWSTAARARDPHKDWREAFSDMKLDMSAPGAFAPPHYLWKASVEQSRYAGETYKFSRFKLETGLPQSEGVRKILWGKPKAVPVEQHAFAGFYTKGPHMPWDYFGGTTAWQNAWLFTLTPLNRLGATLGAAKALGDSVDEDATRTTHKYSFFHHLFGDDMVWGAATHLILCLGLCRKEVDGRGMAVDAFIHGIERGRIDTNLMATQLVALSQEPWIKLNRLTQSLKTVSDNSPLHAYVVSEILQKWLAKTDLKTRQMFMALEILLNALTITKQPLSNPMQEALSVLKGSSKAAKTAKALLGLKHNDPAMNDYIRALAIAGRL